MYAHEKATNGWDSLPVPGSTDSDSDDVDDDLSAEAAMAWRFAVLRPDGAPFRLSVDTSFSTRLNAWMESTHSDVGAW